MFLSTFKEFYRTMGFCEELTLIAHLATHLNSVDDYLRIEEARPEL